MTFTLACGDVMPGCAARFEHTDKQALLGQVAAHAAQAHGLVDLTPEVVAQVESRILQSA
ncbi:DUF1059 domain-containing protein [Nocardioides campestrisoli]|uniref:DUF1059 domain-containing protein n=1 Tax=Nocardioides campestrisoli TaxID=2736757 RepID=UPI0015E6CB65|nr:DUF1059 domain-containing protein [Nocardioides campestrisoli]